MSFCVYQSTIGGEKENEMLVFVFIFWCVVVTFQYRVNVKKHVQVNFTVASQFYIHINVDLYIHAFILLYGGTVHVLKIEKVE